MGWRGRSAILFFDFQDIILRIGPSSADQFGFCHPGWEAKGVPRIKKAVKFYRFYQNGPITIAKGKGMEFPANILRNDQNGSSDGRNGLDLRILEN
jgi:hypothetical protein